MYARQATLFLPFCLYFRQMCQILLEDRGRRIKLLTYSTLESGAARPIKMPPVVVTFRARAIVQAIILLCVAYSIC